MNLQPERIREPNPDAEDEAHDADVQRKLDDETAAAMEAKRAASAMSPEILSLQDAAAAGRQAGMQDNGSSMNPYQAGLAEYDVWESARSVTIGARLNGALARKARVA